MRFTKPHTKRRDAERNSRERVFRDELRVRLNTLTRMQEYYK